MSEEKNLGDAAELAETKDDKVSVICTPAGGAQTVRLELDKRWEKEMTEDDLAQAIGQAENKFL